MRLKCITLRLVFFTGVILLNQATASAVESFVIQGVLDGAKTALTVEKAGQVFLQAEHRAFPFWPKSLPFHSPDGRPSYRAHFVKSPLTEVRIEDSVGTKLGWIRETPSARSDRRYFKISDELTQKTAECLIHQGEEHRRPKAYIYSCWADKRRVAQGSAQISDQGSAQGSPHVSVKNQPTETKILLENLTEEIRSPLLVLWVSSHLAQQSANVFWQTQKDRWLIPGGIGLGLAGAGVATYQVVKPFAPIGDFSLRAMEQKDISHVQEIALDPLIRQMSGDDTFVTNPSTRHFVVVTQERVLGIPHEKIVGVYTLGDLTPTQLTTKYLVPADEEKGAKAAWVAYYIAKDHWRKGLATRMLGEVIRAAAQKWNITVLVTTVLRTNLGSQRVLLKNHFTPYGESPERIHFILR